MSVKTENSNVMWLAKTIGEKTMERIENRMVIDSEWKHTEPSEIVDILKQPGYHEMGTNVFVPECEAYDYALERCLNGTEQDQKEFKDMLVEWFYSGNWIKERH